MKKEGVDNSICTVETTLGELVETITQIALELGKSEDEAYQLTSLTIESLLRRQNKADGVDVIN